MSTSRRILVNDYVGHPFQVQLSRALAARGHAVLHTYCSAFNTPRGALEPRSGDPRGLEIRALALAQPFQKYGLASRWRQEREYGRLMVGVLEEFGPDAVLSANTPLGAQQILQRTARRRRAAFVYWVQDLLGVGIRSALRKRLPVAGALVGRALAALEQRLLARSDHVVLISEDFLPYVPARLVREQRTSVIENWAPLEEVPAGPKRNAWSERHGLASHFCFLYAGTLGLKHDPALLVALAEGFLADSDVRIVVLSEGPGRDFLERERRGRHLVNLVLRDYQPFEVMPEVLATGDVLVTLLESDAGVFSVPSKTLTYLCAHRPVLIAAPRSNLATRIVERARAGISVPPGDPRACQAAARQLYHDPSLRAEFAANARRYAERTFDIERICDRFQEVVDLGQRRAQGATLDDGRTAT